VREHGRDATTARDGPDLAPRLRHRVGSEPFEARSHGPGIEQDWRSTQLVDAPKVSA
jgi:hypothetical protein